MRRCFRSSKKQTALFFSSDYYALEASNFLQNRGIKVPEEISIAGFDDVTYATLARPKADYRASDGGWKSTPCRRSPDALDPG